MQYTGLLLFCLFALTAAKPAEDLQMLIRALLDEIEEEGELQERGIGAVKYGGTNVGEDYVEVKVIRNMEEVKADQKSHKPLYSLIYGKGTHDPNSSQHSLTSWTWSQLDKCQNGAEGCFMIRNLKPNTEYWFQLEVQMWINGAYEYIESRKDVEQIRTKGRQENAPWMSSKSYKPDADIRT